MTNAEVIYPFLCRAEHSSALGIYTASQKHESTSLHTYVLNEFLKADRSCLGWLGLAWAALGCLELPWAALGCLGLPWEGMGWHGLSWAGMGCHGLSWAVMGWHELALIWAGLGAA